MFHLYWFLSLEAATRAGRGWNPQTDSTDIERWEACIRHHWDSTRCVCEHSMKGILPPISHILRQFSNHQGIKGAVMLCTKCTRLVMPVGFKLAYLNWKKVGRNVLVRHINKVSVVCFLLTKNTSGTEHTQQEEFKITYKDSPIGCF